jgi:hypothetical protein
VPGPLTLTVTLESEAAERPPQLVGRLSARERDDAVAECRALAGGLIAGRDFTREIALTEELALGDTLLVRDAAGALAGFAICHSAPLVEGRVREELRVLKLAAASREAVPALAAAVCDFARRSGTRRAAFRVQGDYPWLYSDLLRRRGRVRWTDLRMTFEGHAEPAAASGAVLSNWEI